MSRQVSQKMATQSIKAFLSFLTLFLIDIAPYPVTPSLAIPVILIRPRWFCEWVERIYAL